MTELVEKYPTQFPAFIASLPLNNVLFASDAPFDPEKGTMFVRLGLETMEAMTLSEEERYMIFEGNARKQLKL